MGRQAAGGPSPAVWIGDAKLTSRYCPERMRRKPQGALRVNRSLLGDRRIICTQVSAALQGEWGMARVTGPYDYAENSKDEGGDYQHVGPLSSIRDARGEIAVVEADDEHVAARLHASMRNSRGCGTSTRSAGLAAHAHLRADVGWS